jgi:hypothetical protein
MRMKFHVSAEIEPLSFYLPGKSLDYYATKTGFLDIFYIGSNKAFFFLFSLSSNFPNNTK